MPPNPKALSRREKVTYVIIDFPEIELSDRDVAIRDLLQLPRDNLHQSIVNYLSLMVDDFDELFHKDIVDALVEALNEPSNDTMIFTPTDTTALMDYKGFKQRLMKWKSWHPSADYQLVMSHFANDIRLAAEGYAAKDIKMRIEECCNTLPVDLSLLQILLWILLRCEGDEKELWSVNELTGFDIIDDPLGSHLVIYPCDDDPSFFSDLGFTGGSYNESQSMNTLGGWTRLYPVATPTPTKIKHQ